MMNDLYNRYDYSNVFIWKAYDKRTNIYTNKLGWWTNRTTRPKLIARGLHAFAYGDLIVNSSYLLGEMQDFQRDPLLAKARAVSGKHDDRIMALLMGYWGAHDEEFLNGEDIGEQRRLQGKVKEIEQEYLVAKPGRRVDYQNSPMSFKKMMELADVALADGE